MSGTDTHVDRNETLVLPRAPIAYVLKGYPRLSELFIASEIWRLERLGVELRLFVLKPSDEDVRHRVVDEIEAVVTYLPETTSLSGTSTMKWLRENFRSFRPAVIRTASSTPTRFLRALGSAARQSWRARTGLRPKKIYLKEFLQAVALADAIQRSNETRNNVSASTIPIGHLHGHFAHGATTVTWLAAMLCDLPFSFTGHAKDIYQGSLNPAGLLSRKMRDAAFVVTCTEANVNHLNSIAPDVLVELSYHGLNADFARLVEQQPGSHTRGANDRPLLVSVGRAVPKKGFDVLLRAVAQLVDRGIDIDVVIAGESGSESSSLRALCDSLGLGECVQFLGTLSQPQIHELYLRANVFALACRVVDDGDRDGIPNVMMEAMATGLPVVSTRVSGIPELIEHEVNGLLVAPDCPSELADAILQLLKDPQLAERIGSAGAETIRDRFDGDRTARQLAARFAEACA